MIRDESNDTRCFRSQAGKYSREEEKARNISTVSSCWQFVWKSVHPWRTSMLVWLVELCLSTSHSLSLHRYHPHHYQLYLSVCLSVWVHRNKEMRYCSIVTEQETERTNEMNVHYYYYSSDSRSLLVLIIISRWTHTVQISLSLIFDGFFSRSSDLHSIARKRK